MHIYHQMDLDTQTLKECRLGPIVLFYTKTKRVTPAINRSADSLVQAWSRPIIKRPASFRNRLVETQENMERDVELEEEVRRERRKRFDVATALKENEGRKGARLYLSKVNGGDTSPTMSPLSVLVLMGTFRKSNIPWRRNRGCNITRKICSMSHASRWITGNSTSLQGR